MKSRYAMYFLVIAGACGGGSDAGLDASDLVNGVGNAPCNSLSVSSDATPEILALRDTAAVYPAEVSNGTLSITAGDDLLQRRINLISSKIELADGAVDEIGVGSNRQWMTLDPTTTLPVVEDVDFVFFVLTDARQVKTLVMSQFKTGSDELNFIQTRISETTSTVYCATDLNSSIEMPQPSPTTCVRQDTQVPYSVGECYYKPMGMGMCRCTASAAAGLLGGGTTNASWSCSADSLISQACRN